MADKASLTASRSLLSPRLLDPSCKSSNPRAFDFACLSHRSRRAPKICFWAIDELAGSAWERNPVPIAAPVMSYPSGDPLAILPTMC